MRRNSGTRQPRLAQSLEAVQDRHLRGHRLSHGLPAEGPVYAADRFGSLWALLGGVQRAARRMRGSVVKLRGLRALRLAENE